MIVQLDSFTTRSHMSFYLLTCSPAQTAFVLKKTEDGTLVGEVYRTEGIAESTFYGWRKRFTGLMTFRGQAASSLVGGKCQA